LGTSSIKTATQLALQKAAIDNGKYAVLGMIASNIEPGSAAPSTLCCTLWIMLKRKLRRVSSPRYCATCNNSGFGNILMEPETLPKYKLQN